MAVQRVITGDCREVMAGMEPATFDAVVCDPPYDLTNRVPDVMVCLACRRVLGGRDGTPDACPRCGGELVRQRSKAAGGGFMGKEWDGTGVAFDPATWEAVLRVLRPGGVLMAFGGARTWHRLAVAIEDAGFQIFDTLMWLHGQGFPKHKTLLKPAWEPVIVAKKPGAGGLHIEAGRLDYASEADKAGATPGGRVTSKPSSAIAATPDAGRDLGRVEFDRPALLGRWPANLALDEEAARWLDEASGERGGRDHRPYQGGRRPGGFGAVGAESGSNLPNGSLYDDEGGPSRFFYCSKADRAERDIGMAGMPASTEKAVESAHSTVCLRCGRQRVNVRGACECSEPEWARVPQRAIRNHHPCVKPLALMQWLVRLACPPGGTLLDPFLGSGSTLIAADREGIAGVGIEQDTEYAAIARARIVGDCPLFAAVAD